MQILKRLWVILIAMGDLAKISIECLQKINCEWNFLNFVCIDWLCCDRFVSVWSDFKCHFCKCWNFEWFLMNIESFWPFIRGINDRPGDFISMNFRLDCELKLHFTFSIKLWCHRQIMWVFFNLQKCTVSPWNSFSFRI